jgi:ABC-type dipeptide/oligopeptide/nickel transport system permease component
VLNATLLLLAVVVLALNLAVDLLYHRLDPTAGRAR